jgi:RES domain-containing protein
MITAFRIIKRNQAATCFDGEGARLYGGRWNSKGNRVVYTSASQSLALLETFVHLDSYAILSSKYCLRTAQFDEALCETVPLAGLPAGWDADITINATRVIGDAWVQQARSAVLIVPSAISPPPEYNYLINPNHPDFSKISLGPAQEFFFPRRLLK